MLSGLAGFAAGALHVVTGPDHLAAVAPLAAHSRRLGWRTGATWGLGHGSGVVVLGLAGIAARDVLSLDRLASVAELLVGVMLVGLGIWAIRRALRVVVHTHEHDHDGLGTHEHMHLHVGNHAHSLAHLVRTAPRLRAGASGLVAADPAHARHTHAVLGIGFLHGAAGGGHLFGVLPSLALPPAAAVVYLTCYLLSAVFSMAGFGLLVGRLTRRGGPRRLRLVMAGSGVLAVATGVFWTISGLPAVV